MGLSSSTVADQQHVLPTIDVVAPGQLLNQRAVDRQLDFELERVKRLDHREPGRLDPTLGRTDFTVLHLTLGQTQQERLVIGSLALAQRCQFLVFPQHRRQTQLLEVVIQQHRWL